MFLAQRVALAGILAAFSALAQNLIFGSLSGTVSDPGGATIPAARMTLVNEGTGDVRNSTSDAAGSYQFLSLTPGAYRLECEMQGFKRFVRPGIVVEVNRALRIDVDLEIGNVAESVEVAAATPLIEAQSSSLGQVVDGRKVRDLPLNGRNPLALVALSPAVIPQNGSQRAPAGQNFFAWGNFQIGGGTTNQSQTYLDGAPVNLNYANLLALVPTQDSLAEFKVQTSALSAEFGRTSGGVINLATRSGTNRFHGTLYEFLRVRALNANTFFNNRNGVERPAFTQNQYGGALGGPVVKDKLFFFANAEGYRQRVGRSLLLSVPTEAMRAGDFSNSRTAAGALIPVHDPLSVCGRLGNPACGQNAAGAEVVLRQPFPGNVIPRSRQNPASLAYLANSWGLPNVPGLPVTNLQNYAANASAGANADWLTFRGDWNLSSKQRIYGRYSLWKGLTLKIDPFGNGFYPSELVQGSPEDFTTQQVLIADTYMITPTTIADIRLSFIRQRYDRRSDSYGFDLTKLGWPSFMNQQVSERFLPNVSAQGLSGGFPNIGSYIAGRTEDRNVAGSLTHVAGSHTLRFGAELRVGPFNYKQLAGGSGNFSFTNVFTANNPFAPAGGIGFASFLLGTPASGTLPTTQPISGQQVYRAFFGQDDWRVTRKLTVNVGLRYDLAGPWSERYDRMSLFLPDLESPLASRVGLPLRGRFALVNTPDRPSRNPVDMPKSMLAPRVGLAYAVTPRMVIRSGYGIFWIPNQSLLANSPYGDTVNSLTNTMVPTLDNVVPFNTFNNPFPQGLNQSPGRDPSFESRLWSFSPSTLTPHNPQGYMQQWNFNVQRELPFGFFADAAYAGSKGTHLPVGGFQLNQLPDQHLALGAALSQQVPNPFFGIVNQGALQSRTVARGQLLRPYPQFTGLALNGAGIGTSIYHSFQFKGTRRFGNGGSLLIAYTAAKFITMGSDTFTGWLETDGGVSGFMNFNQFRGERSLSSFDVPQRFVASYAVDLPFGSGKHFGANLPGLAGKLVSGWGFEGITTFQSGMPLRLTAQPNVTGSLGGGSRPNSTGVSARLDGSAQSRLTRWFDTRQFTAAPAFTFGNVARTLPDVRSHGTNNWDLSLFKNTTFGEGEKYSVQFRAEVFNLANRVQFGFPGQAFGTPQFGVISQQPNEPRLLQLALRFGF
ncbi:MAG: TonB-dependent receptor [Bryobacteraceae bacterium]|nr:TonB-dependent receptor [Bryobacteraceae bacterium]